MDAKLKLNSITNKQLNEPEKKKINLVKMKLKMQFFEKYIY